MRVLHVSDATAQQWHVGLGAMSLAVGTPMAETTVEFLDGVGVGIVAVPGARYVVVGMLEMMAPQGMILLLIVWVG